MASSEVVGLDLTPQVPGGAGEEEDVDLVRGRVGVRVRVRGRVRGRLRVRVRSRLRVRVMVRALCGCASRSTCPVRGSCSCRLTPRT